jgi:MarR family transcriptional repressor of emrRAB
MPELEVHIVASPVQPVLAATMNDADALHRLCRLCDRNICTDLYSRAPKAVAYNEVTY